MSLSAPGPQKYHFKQKGEKMIANVCKWGKIMPFAHICAHFHPFLLKMIFPWSRSAKACRTNGILGVWEGHLGKKPENYHQNHFLMKSG